MFPTNPNLSLILLRYLTINEIISAKVFEIFPLDHYSRLENLENKHNHQSHQEKLLIILGIDDYFGDTFDAKDDQFD